MVLLGSSALIICFGGGHLNHYSPWPTAPFTSHHEEDRTSHDEKREKQPDLVQNVALIALNQFLHSKWLIVSRSFHEVYTPECHFD